MAFWTYILRCSGGSDHTGHTDNLDVRVGQHQSGIIGGYTYKRRPIALARTQDFVSRVVALQAKRQIKGWTRGKKEALIAGDWASLSDLARSRRDADSRPSTGSGRTEV